MDAGQGIFQSDVNKSILLAILISWDGFAEMTGFKVYGRGKNV